MPKLVKKISVFTKNLEISQLVKENNFDEIILLTQHEPYFWLLPNMPEILCTIEQINVPCTVINSIELESPYRFLKVESWVTYFIYWYKFLSNFYDHGIDQNKFTYLYAFMVNRPAEHRCALLEILTEQKLLYYGAISWHKIPSIERQKKYNKANFVQKRLSDNFRINQAFKFLPKEYFDSFFILVAESIDTDFFMTEKILMAIQHEKLFLVAGSVNFHKKLQKLGFLLYDEVFDYRFDLEPDMYLRMRGIVDNIKVLSKIRHEMQTELYLKTYEKRLYNKALLDKLVVNKNFIPKTVTDLIQTGYKNHFNQIWVDNLHL